MNPSRFSEEQIIGMLKDQEAGSKAADICRKYGISSATFYRFKGKYGGMDVSDARRRQSRICWSKLRATPAFASVT